MILAVDAGNTHIVIGCTQNGTVSFTERISTNRQKTEFYIQHRKKKNENKH